MIERTMVWCALIRNNSLLRKTYSGVPEGDGVTPQLNHEVSAPVLKHFDWRPMGCSAPMQNSRPANRKVHSKAPCVGFLKLFTTSEALEVKLAGGCTLLGSVEKSNY
jgi:hypothetical protein